MEEDKDDHSAAFSWWSDSHSRRHQSQWLQTTLSDLESRIKMILNMIQDDGDTFSKRAETFYKRRPELIKMVQDLYRSYCSLAERYDQLRSESFHAAHLKPSPFPSSKQEIQLLKDSNKVNLLEGIQKQAPTLDSESRTPTEQDPSPEAAPSLMPGKPLWPSLKNADVCANTSLNRLDKIVKNLEVDGRANGDFQMDNQEKEKMRNELRVEVSRLIEENTRQQNELIRRNEEKREVIRQLRSQVDRLLEENKVLRSNLPGYKVGMGMMKRSKSGISRLKSLNCIGGFQS